MKKENNKLGKIIKTIIYILILILILYGLVSTNITGFSIGSSEVVTGSFILTIALIFFMILFILLRSKAKT